jgi:YD repeat-containing protein
VVTFCLCLHVSEMKLEFRATLLSLSLVLASGSKAQTQAAGAFDDGCDQDVGRDRIRVVGGCDGIHREGHWVINYYSGEKAEEGSYSRGRKAGIWRTWYKSGSLFSESTYADSGSVTPLFVRQYYESKTTTPQSEITYDPNGKWTIWVSWDPFGRRSEQTSR